MSVESPSPPPTTSPVPAPDERANLPAYYLEELCRRARTYLTAAQVREIRSAFEFGASAHLGQRRRSGEPYITHPLQVATVLADMHMDHQTLIAAILHDVIEDTEKDRAAVAARFGDEVAYIVEGVSKLTQIEFESYAEAQASNFQKMVMAMSKDIRVILVKLADRLHNMRTLGALSPEKRRRIARETLEIYAPIAQRLGINSIRLELEDLGFAALYPKRYRVIEDEVRRIRGNRKEVVQKIGNRLRRRLREEQLGARVLGREKHLYSIYRKMHDKTLEFSDVYDVYAFRIIVDSVDKCYRALGVVHNVYKPVPGRFKDYIAIPKANGYQSLHTVLFGPYGVPIEVQIRTKEMDQVAESGIAAHWLYKTGENAAKNAQKRARDWLRQVIEIQRQAGNSEEFLEHVKVDLFPDTVYVFTPKGEIMELPRGATPVDLAYAIHTDIGNSCVGCRINRRLALLPTPLETGQTVEIVTAPGARPNPSWLNFVVTAKARANIRHYLKNLKHDEARTLGRRMLNRELEALGETIETISTTRTAEILGTFKLEALDTLLEEIGLGNRPAPLVARLLALPAEERADAEPSDASGDAREPQTPRQRAPLSIKGTEGMVVSFPKCCYPIPGDNIIGLLTAGRGITVHRPTCPTFGEFRTKPERWVDVAWSEAVEGEFPVELRIDVYNQRGVLATIAATIADLGANIEDVDLKELDDHYAYIAVVITVRGRKHLADVIRTLRAVPTVSRVIRKRG